MSRSKRLDRSRVRALGDPAREKARLERECFWTWPWGHIRVWRGYTAVDGSRAGHYCVRCGSRSDPS